MPVVIVTGSNTLPLRQLIASKSHRQLIAPNSKTSRNRKSEALVTHKLPATEVLWCNIEPAILWFKSQSGGGQARAAKKAAERRRRSRGSGEGGRYRKYHPTIKYLWRFDPSSFAARRLTAAIFVLWHKKPPALRSNCRSLSPRRQHSLATPRCYRPSIFQLIRRHAELTPAP